MNNINEKKIHIFQDTDKIFSMLHKDIDPKFHNIMKYIPGSWVHHPKENSCSQLVKMS